MNGSAIVAFGAVSPLGRGRAAFAVPPVGEPARFVGGSVEAFVARGMRRSTAALVHALPGGPPDRRAGPLLEAALADCLEALDAARPGWRSSRVGLALGTSSGGMVDAEVLFGALARGERCPDETALAATYAAPFLAARRSLGLSLSREASVLVACASSTVAIGLGHTWLETDACDVVLAGGYDALSVFVAAGFSCLGAVSPSVPRPFRSGREGLALAEGAGLIALVRASEAKTAKVFVTGFGVSSDAVHVTAPDRTGSGLAAAGTAALARAGLAPSSIDLVNAHGTATPFNDAAESRALHLIGCDFDRVVVHAPKGTFGHALGAAGVLETLAAVDAMERGIFPASAGGEQGHPMDEDAFVPLHEVSRAGSVQRVLKLSAAFGGVNAALALSNAPMLAAARNAPFVPRWSGRFDVAAVPSAEALAALLGVSLDRIARVDDLGALVASAVLAATADRPPGWLADKALVVQSGYATMGRNDRFYRRVLERDAAAAEPRRFPGTSPNLAAGEASILFGMRGPVLTLGGDPALGDQASVVAEDLLRAGHVDAAIVVQVEEASAAAACVASAGGRPVPTSSASARVVERSLASTARFARLAAESALDRVAERAGVAESLVPVSL